MFCKLSTLWKVCSAGLLVAAIICVWWVIPRFIGSKYRYIEFPNIDLPKGSDLEFDRRDGGHFVLRKINGDWLESGIHRIVWNNRYVMGYSYVGAGKRKSYFIYKEWMSDVITDEESTKEQYNKILAESGLSEKGYGPNQKSLDLIAPPNNLTYNQRALEYISYEGEWLVFPLLLMLCMVL